MNREQLRTKLTDAVDRLQKMILWHGISTEDKIVILAMAKAWGEDAPTTNAHFDEVVGIINAAN